MLEHHFCPAAAASILTACCEIGLHRDYVGLQEEEGRQDGRAGAQAAGKLARQEVSDSYSPRPGTPKGGSPLAAAACPCTPSKLQLPTGSI